MASIAPIKGGSDAEAVNVWTPYNAAWDGQPMLLKVFDGSAV